MSVLSDQIYRRQTIRKQHHSLVSRKHIVLDFLEWVAVFMFIALLVTNQGRAQELFQYLLTIAGR